MIWLALLPAPSLATETRLPMEASTVAAGTQRECTSARFVQREATWDVDLSAEAIATMSKATVSVEGSHACELRLDRVIVSIDGATVYTESPRLRFTREGSFTESFSATDPTPRVLAAGPHRVTIVLQGYASLPSDTMTGTLSGDFITWRDRDGDGDPDRRLQDGNDCDDTDPERSSIQPEVADGVDNDCDGRIDNNLDSDDDGISDADEGRVGTDPESDDSDGDGAEDGLEWGGGDDPVDTDGDGLPDVLDTDSDGDTILDEDEFEDPTDPVDTDGDLMPDYQDTDDDNDGLPTRLEWEGDADDDGIPDWRDPDSDNDGALDGAEGTDDRDGDGTPNHRDPGSDLDAVTEPFEPPEHGFGLGCQSLPSPAGGALMLLALAGLARRRRRSR